MRKLLAAAIVAGALAFAVVPPQPSQAVPTPSPIYPAPSASPFPQGCVYNSTLPTLVNGATAEIECDQFGHVLTNWTINVPSPIPIQGAQYTHTSVGSTISVGGVAQNWATAGAIQHGCAIQNLSFGPLYIQMDGNAASTTSLQLRANGGYYECSTTAGPSTSASIFGATTGQRYYAEVW